MTICKVIKETNLNHMAHLQIDQACNGDSN